MSGAANEPIPTIRWVDGRVRILDQRALPRREVFLSLATPPELIRAIRSLAVRGAPALGVAGAYGVALAAVEAGRKGVDPVRHATRAGRRIAAARPTAVNLSYGVDEAMSVVRSRSRIIASADDLALRVKAVGDAILEEDLEASRRMAAHGAGLVPEGKPVVTHCNTGGLATAGLGTALAVIRAAVAARGVPEVLVDETRPLLQGGRLTLWELRRAGVPARLVCDGAAAWAIRTLGAGCVLVGADRIAANGDVANKIGTLSLALAAHDAGIPFLVVAPSTSIDARIPDGASIPIEERPPEEVARASGWTRGDAVVAFNPAFDVTPARLVTHWITERGVERPPFTHPGPAAAPAAAD